MSLDTITYNDQIVRRFALASLIWGIVAMLVGVLLALQFVVWQANVGEILSFGRLRPVHTSAVLFAFVGNMMFAGVYYSAQRLLGTAVRSRVLANLHFWAWQVVIGAGLVTIPLGFTQGKEFAEFEWPIDLALLAVWIVFAINLFSMIANRRRRRLYVSVWFYIATVIAFGLVHAVGSLAVPLSLLESVGLWGGTNDALVSWWYGQNAIAFLMIVPVLGIMYYFVPRVAERPLFSRTLSVAHFWALIFLLIWAGPRNMLNTALPDWLQTLGVIASIVLVAPTLGGMLNGLLTLRGTWDKLRTEPVLKFFVVALVFYGLVAFEAALVSLKSVSGLSHYTDWMIAHAHAGGLGWNGFMAAGMLYFLIPKLWGTDLHSKRAANIHFALALTGIGFYVVAMWTSGITQGLMWRAEAAEGGLRYASFLETSNGLRLMYIIRLVGGSLYLAGFGLMGWNIFRTVRAGAAVDGKESLGTDETGEPQPARSWWSLLLSMPVWSCVGVLGALVLGTQLNSGGTLALIMVAGLIATIAIGVASIRPACLALAR